MKARPSGIRYGACDMVNARKFRNLRAFRKQQRYWLQERWGATLTPTSSRHSKADALNLRELRRYCHREGSFHPGLDRVRP
jgi:hypothetical protein